MKFVIFLFLFRKVAPQCHKCKKPIAPPSYTNEVTRVLAMGNSYHTTCYRCEVRILSKLQILKLLQIYILSILYYYLIIITNNKI